jgi:hypothetical protein
MAWTAPMTAVANTAFTAAQFNTHVRDNLLETAPAKATGAVSNGSYFVKTATNSIVNRLAQTNGILTSQSRSSSSYGNLSTVGPAVTATTGTMALVLFACNVDNNSGNSSYMSVEVSGATSISATDDYAVRWLSSSANFSGGTHKLFTTLTPGSNTFTAKYRVNGGTGTWDNRYVTVIPF